MSLKIWMVEPSFLLLQVQLLADEETGNGLGRVHPLELLVVMLIIRIRDFDTKE